MSKNTNTASASSKHSDSKPSKVQPNKVNATKAKKDEDDDEDGEEKVKKERVEYTGKRNEQGRLTAVPEDFIATDHKPLKRPDFVSDDLFLSHKARLLKIKGTAMLERAEKLAAQADQIKKFGDPDKRAKVRKFQKLAEQMKALEKLLSDEGIDVEEIGD